MPLWRTAHAEQPAPAQIRDQFFGRPGTHPVNPALRREAVAAAAREKLAAIDGVLSVDFNTVSGSVLILYDSARLPKERLFAVGEAWAIIWTRFRRAAGARAKLLKPFRLEADCPARMV